MGCLSRAVGDMALARAEGTSQVLQLQCPDTARERKDYYEQLERAQKGRLTTPWLDWFRLPAARRAGRGHANSSGVLNKAQFWQRWQAHPDEPAPNAGAEPRWTAWRQADQCHGPPSATPLRIRAARHRLILLARGVLRKLEGGGVRELQTTGR